MKIISHRASNITKYRSNTKEAIIQVLNHPNIDGVEFDVRMTKDKKIVIIHDPIINFVSDGSGIVKKMKLSKLLKYNFGTKAIPQKISTLDNVLKEINNNKIILIEIKEEDLEIVDKVYQIIKNYSYLNLYFCSFNEKIVKLLKKYNLKCALIIGNGLNNKKIYNHYDFNMITYLYKDKVSKTKETFLWTINENKEDLENYYIITDNPTLFY